MCHKSCHSEDWFMWFSIVIAIGTMVTLGLSFYMFGDSRASTNYSIFADKNEVPSTKVADIDGFLRGHLKMNQNQKIVEWEFIYDKLNTVVSIYIMGPIGDISTEEGPVKLALCGNPSTSSCDLSTPHKIKGKITHKLPENDTLRETITTIRKTPAFYKLCVKTLSGALICSNLIP